MFTIPITLTKEEMQIGAMIGSLRNIESIEDGRKFAHGFSEKTAWRIHTEGTMGEIAFAKAANVYWEPRINTFEGADIGDDVQVRTSSENDGELIIRPPDNPDHDWVLVTGIAPKFIVRGYMPGHIAKANNNWFKRTRTRPPCWFVPQKKLYDIRDLIGRLHE